MQQVPINRIIQAIYLLLSVLFYFPLCHYLDCNDTLQYIVLARHYASGDLMHAINDYWGPLLSWILVPFIRFGAQGFFVLKIIQVFIGSGVLLLTCLLLDQKTVPDKYRIFFKLAAVPLILCFALLNGTPDLLVLFWMLMLLLLLSKPGPYFSSLKSALKCGIIGALLYFTKTAGFFFFLTLFTVLHAYFFFFRKETERTRVVRFFLCGTGTFLLLALPWIIVLSNTYEKPTFSSSGAYNFGIIGPAINPEVYGELNHPFYMGKLYEPSDPLALNAWESPSAADVPHWNPLHSKAGLKHYLRVIWKNIRSIQSYNFGADPGTILVLGWLLLLAIKKKKAFSFFSENLILLFFPVLLSLSYIFVLVNHRYVWLNDVVILILAADLAVRLADIKKYVAIAFSAAFMLLVTYQSWKEIKPSLGDGTANWKAGETFSSFDHTPGRVASLWSHIPYSYDYSSLVCYLSGKTYMGLLLDETKIRETKDISDELEKFKVKYVFTWGNECDPVLLTHGRAKLLQRYPEAKLSIYIFQ